MARPTLPRNPCEKCGKPCKHRYQTICSSECRRPLGKCERCGKPNERIGKRKNHRFCSSECWYAFKTIHVASLVPCTFCGKLIERMDRGYARSFCNAACRGKHDVAVARGVPDGVVKCAACGQPAMYRKRKNGKGIRWAKTCGRSECISALADSLDDVRESVGKKWFDCITHQHLRLSAKRATRKRDRDPWERRISGAIVSLRKRHPSSPYKPVLALSLSTWSKCIDARKKELRSREYRRTAPAWEAKIDTVIGNMRKRKWRREES